MDNILELKTIWESQKKLYIKSVNFDGLSESILLKIKKTEQKIHTLNIFKTIAVSTLMLYFIYLNLKNGINSIVLLSGFIIVLLSTVITMIYYWKIQFRTSNLNYNLPQKDFLTDAMKQMKSFRNTFVRLFRVLVFFMILGINIIYIDLLIELPYLHKIMYHIGFTLLFILIYFLGIKFREKKFYNEFQPLIDEISELNNDV